MPSQILFSSITGCFFCLVDGVKERVMSSYKDICSKISLCQETEEDYRTAAYVQLLTFVELFEFAIGAPVGKDLVGFLKIDEKGVPLTDQNEPLHVHDRKVLAAVCLYTQDRQQHIYVPIAIRPTSRQDCYIEIGYSTAGAKEFYANFSYGALGVKNFHRENPLAYLEQLFIDMVNFVPFKKSDPKNAIA